MRKVEKYFVPVDVNPLDLVEQGAKLMVHDETVNSRYNGAAFIPVLQIYVNNLCLWIDRDDLASIIFEGETWLV